jgi:hypothetical protein
MIAVQHQTKNIDEGAPQAASVVTGDSIAVDRPKITAKNWSCQTQERRSVSRVMHWQEKPAFVSTMHRYHLSASAFV